MKLNRDSFSFLSNVVTCKIVYQRLEPIQAAEEKKDDRSRLAAIIREVDRFLSDGLVKVFHPTIQRNILQVPYNSALLSIFLHH